jgi:hypothetical protein
MESIERERERVDMMCINLSAVTLTHHAQR